MHNLNRTHITQTQETRLYSCSVPIIGLTGSIATGKSTVTKSLKHKGFIVIDADALIKSIYKQTETLEFLRANFSENIIKGDLIDFKALRSLFFQDTNVKSKLEHFLYTKMPEAFAQELEQIGNQSFIFYDVPLLFEKGIEKKLDASVVVFCPQSLQVERLIKRDDITRDFAYTLIKSQIDIEMKKSMATFVIDNSSSIENLEKSVNSFISQLIS